MYGRTIFKSIRKFVIYQLSINVCAVFIAFIGPLLGFSMPLSVTQMLWVNLVMDTLAALAFGGEPALEEYMNEHPKRRDESVINNYMWSEIITSGVVISIVCIVFLLVPYFKSLFRPDATGIYFYSGFFALFIFSSVVNGFNTRTDSLNLFKRIGSNSGFLKVMGMIAVVQVLLIYFGGNIFRTAGLDFKEWVVVILLSLIIVPVDLIRKLILKSIHKDNFRSV